MRHSRKSSSQKKRVDSNKNPIKPNEKFYSLRNIYEIPHYEDSELFRKMKEDLQTSKEKINSLKNNLENCEKELLKSKEEKEALIQSVTECTKDLTKEKEKSDFLFESLKEKENKLKKAEQYKKELFDKDIENKNLMKRLKEAEDRWSGHIIDESWTDMSDESFPDTLSKFQKRQNKEVMENAQKMIEMLMQNKQNFELFCKDVSNPEHFKDLIDQYKYEEVILKLLLFVGLLMSCSDKKGNKIKKQRPKNVPKLSLSPQLLHKAENNAIASTFSTKQSDRPMSSELIENIKPVFSVELDEYEHRISKLDSEINTNMKTCKEALANSLKTPSPRCSEISSFSGRVSINSIKPRKHFTNNIGAHLNQNILQNKKLAVLKNDKEEINSSDIKAWFLSENAIQFTGGRKKIKNLLESFLIARNKGGLDGSPSGNLNFVQSKPRELLVSGDLQLIDEILIYENIKVFPLDPTKKIVKNK
ncbi:unnamed protein product [Blepharisma stoltei]|uniref:Uncharacterized protein n=1 Tax=Blepharisma stoltei TaxID=1481888 RepID=A0AAU9IXK8_9CILI|nr:unnamed protein product [Blepharisma stoltei]